MSTLNMNRALMMQGKSSTGTIQDLSETDITHILESGFYPHIDQKQQKKDVCIDQ